MTVAVTFCKERHTFYKVTDVHLFFKCYNSKEIGAPVVFQ